MNIEEVKAKILSSANKKKWVYGALAALVLGPLSWFLLWGVLGITALGLTITIAGAIAIAVANYVPVYTMKMANRKIQSIIEEAEKNPIPTLWAQHAQDGEEIKEMAAAIADYDAEIIQVEGNINNLSADLTEQDKETFKQEIVMMRSDLQFQYQELGQVRADHAKQEIEIKRADAIWKIGMSMQKANAKNMANRARDTLEKIKRETALDAVTRSLSKGKAGLRARLEARRHAGGVSIGSGQPALENNPSQTIDMPTTAPGVLYTISSESTSRRER